LQDLGINGGVPEDRRKPGGIGFGATLTGKRDDAGMGGALGQRIEQGLVRLLGEAEKVLVDKRGLVLALAHALESHKTLTGEDVIAVLEGRQGPLVDGRPYADPAFIAELEGYHEAAVAAHRHHAPVSATLPVPATLVGEVVDDSGEEESRRAAATPAWAVGTETLPGPQA
jgi:hypothetical protein